MSSENLTGKPVVSRTLPGSRKRASIPTVSDSNAQINPNITQPYIADRQPQNWLALSLTV